MLLRSVLFALFFSLAVVFNHLYYIIRWDPNLGSTVTPAGLCTAEAVWPNTKFRMVQISAELNDSLSERVYAGPVLRFVFDELLCLIYADPALQYPQRICVKILRALTRNSIRKHDWQNLSVRTLLGLRSDWRKWQFITANPYLRTLRCALFIESALGARTVLRYVSAGRLTLFQLIPSFLPAPMPQVRYSHVRVGGARSVKSFMPHQVNPYLVGDGASLNSGDRLTYDSHSDLSVLPVRVSSDPLKVVANIPLRSLATYLTRQQLMQVARVHGISFKSKETINALVEAVSDHECTCPQSVSIFNLLANEEQRRSEGHRERNAVYKKASKASATKRTKASEALRRKWKTDKIAIVHKKKDNASVPCSEFPPPPASQALRHSVITGMCADLAPTAFEETGCAVCGRLTLNSNLSPKSELDVDWSLLASDSSTRKERFSTEDPIEELDGPVLAAGCDMVCIECESKMRKHVRPPHSLANHIWIGELPWQLKDLTWAERMMIAKVRHNRCVVRVASGRGKLVANAIMFATPIRKVYDVLPISRDELSQVLAFVFIGSARPTEKEFVRTPMFVRRQRVRDALEWLKLNHQDYECLEISQENLDAIPEAGIPCGVDWKETADGESNLVPEAMSVDNAGDVDDGTADGPCSFAVAGLTGEQYALDDIRTLKMKALDHLKSGGKTLGIGQAEEPESTFRNMQLYPQTFPWLFPYGHGGIGHPSHKRFISEDEHKRHLLMYHDKRFQMDMYFPMVAFNDAQIKSAKSGSHIMADRKKFKSIAQRLANVEPEVLADLAARLEKGEHIKDKTPAEQVCFDLLEDLEHAGNKVQGSLTSKKYMRNEVWSLISFKGAPSWFITFSPVDTNHPLCLYFADTQINFSPKLRNSDERMRLISQNPVAAARFFHYITESFIKNVLGVGADRPGLYGDTDAYYGTVEQQGRLTLHMHMLVWIKSALSPQEIRDRLLSPDAAFQKDLVAYLESCHVGEFLTGTIDEVKAKVPYHSTARKGLHDVIDHEEYKPVPVQYSDPTQTMPTPPPPLCDCEHAMCEDCARSKEWWTNLREITDDLILRSNVHSCRRPVAGTDLSKVQTPGSRVRPELRGCLRKDGTCSARFPRDIFTKTEVDPEDGSINIKKLEPMLNCVTPDLTYCLRCNTDVTSLLSGTSVKAVVAYISDYITKSSLKMYHMFDSVRAVLNNNTVAIGTSDQHKDNCRRMLMKMVNSLTSKLQIGSPMASLYLLKNPDHYTNHKFKVFWWKSYVSAVRNAWSADAVPSYPVQTDDNGNDPEKETEVEQVVLMKSKSGVVAATNVDDYVSRPKSFENVNLYEFIQMTTRLKRTLKQQRDFLESLDEPASDAMVVDETADDTTEWLVNDTSDGHIEDLLDVTSGDVSFHAFEKDHPLWETHYIRCDRKDLDVMVPNFVGGSLPRMDQGDREYYCCTMLTLFKPWRKGKDLKSDADSWHETFIEHQFADRAQTLMKHFNVRYECNDARDDYSALDKKKRTTLPLFGGNSQTGLHGDEADETYCDWDDEFPGDVEQDFVKGPKQLAKEKSMKEVERVLHTAGWTAVHRSASQTFARLIPTKHLSGAQWKLRIANLKEAVFEAKFRNAPAGVKKTRNYAETSIGNTVKVLEDFYFTKFFRAKSKKAQVAIDTISTDYKLNTDQERAFRLVANHAIDDSAPPLRMYLGGVGGTGKSQVIKALVNFFEGRNESHRFIVLGPTGTSAALLNGSTYHSVLGIRDSMDDSERVAGVTIRKVQERLRGVEYVFIDEVSMVSCNALYSISARLALCLGEPNEPFGGMNMIVAGDFGQLPPVNAKALYSPDSTVSPILHAKQSILDQKNTIGKIIWQQMTTVVILKQNMRQTAETADDVKFRTALTNMRFAACTKEDLHYLESRTISKRDDRPNFNNLQFRNVSIITAFNAPKDKINELGARKYAEETGQELTSFYSNDSVADNAGDSQRKPKNARGRQTVKLKNKLPPNRQRQLWDAHPSFTDTHIAGRLDLCVGLPVMIRNNEATELCITKGQEGRVAGWVEAVGNHDQRILDTLFVELIDPPKTIRVPDLPENVVALTKTSKKIWCMLPDDMSVQITREQVLVLPNFAMTDYSSQGKTRAINVVDLNNCQSHFSYYTALSRSSTSAGTIILQGMDSRKITRGIHGSLRQEFRELEILNEITRLHYDGKLPLTVQGWNRREIIRAFRVWKGDTFSIGDVHPALQSVQGEDSFGDHAVSTGRWQLVGSDVTTKPKQNESSPVSYKKTQLSVKRKRTGGSKPAPRKKGKTADPIPLGLKWDCVNYSCAYDALFTCMYNIWLDHGPKWSDRFKAINVNVETLGTGFEAVAHKTRSLETVRDQLRANLYNALPANFPMGPVYTYLDKLTDAMFGDSFWGVDTMKCLGCGYIGGQTQGFSCTRTIYKDIILSQQFKHEYRISNWINSLKLSRGNGTCRTCNRQLAIIQHIEKSPPLFYLAVDDPTIRFDTALHIKVSGNSVRYALRGVIYSGQNHFTARIVKEDGAMWYHDGIETGATTVYEGSVHTQNSSFLNTCRRDGIVRNACGVIYAIVD